jgi:hypothetical protein
MDTKLEIFHSLPISPALFIVLNAGDADAASYSNATDAYVAGSWGLGGELGDGSFRRGEKRRLLKGKDVVHVSL